MNFNQSTYKTLETVSPEIKTHIATATQEDIRLFWEDLYSAIQMEISSRDPITNRINEDIRCTIKRKGLKHYQVAEYLGISESTFSKLLRKPIDPDQQQAIAAAIEGIRV